MPLVIPTGHAQVIHSLSLTGDKEPMAVTFGVEIDPAAPQDLSSIATSLHNAFDTEMCKIPHSVYALEATEVRLGSATGLVGAIGIHVGQVRCRGGGSPLPQNCAILFHKRSGLPGRRARGRMYLPGMSEGATSPTGEIEGASVPAFSAIAEAWRALVEGDPRVGRMVILHSAGISATPPPTPVVQLVCDPIIATMRRRLR